MLRKLAVLAFAVILLLPAPLIAQDAPPVPRENGALLYSAPFNDSSGLDAVFGEEWMTYQASGGVATIASSAPGVVLAAMISGKSFGDFIAEVDLLPNPAPASTQYGVLFRADGPPDIDATTYNLIVNPGKSQLAMTKLLAGGRDEDIVDLGGTNLSSLNFDPARPNRLRLEAVGSVFRVFMNGGFAFEATDSMLGAGGFGLTIGSPEDLAQGAKASAQFSNLNIFAPGAQQAAPAAAPDGASAAAADVPALEVPPGGIVGSVLVPSLNVRGGPGLDTAIVGKLKRGETVLVEARDATCAWLQVSGPMAQGWVFSRYMKLAPAPCADVPLAGSSAAPAAEATPAAEETPAAEATPAAEVTPAAKVTPAAEATPEAATAAPAAAQTTGASVTDFEPFGRWTRGNEAWGTFVQSAEKVVRGAAAGKLVYNFPANAPDGRNYVVFKQTRPIAGTPSALTMSVYGDGSGSLLNVWVRDASGQVWQFPFGPVAHTGWRTMTAGLDPAGAWPVDIISGGSAEKKLDYPIQLQALVLDYPGNDAHAGAIYLDNLVAVSK